MFYIGIDIAKRSHQAAVTDVSGNIIVKPFNFKILPQDLHNSFQCLKPILYQKTIVS